MAYKQSSQRIKRNVSVTKRNLSAGGTYHRGDIGLWWIQSGGYELVSGLTPKRQRLVARTPVGGTLEFKYQRVSEEWLEAVEVLEAETDIWIVLKGGSEDDPADGPKYLLSEVDGLHREFARLSLSELNSEVYSFACRHGLLGRNTVLLRHREMYRDFWGEGLQGWFDAVVVVQVVLQLHDAIRQEHHDRIDELIILGGSRKDDLPDIHGIRNWFAAHIRLDLQYIKKKFKLIYVPEELTLIAKLSDLEGHASGLKERNLAAARLILERIVNGLLSEGVRPTVQYEPRGELFLNPTDLLGAIHCQLALELMGRVQAPSFCRTCGMSFYPERKGNVYCSNQCKQKEYRGRQKAKGETNA